MLCPLLLPCDDPGAFAAAMPSGADALVLDLGDAAAPGDREARRRAVRGVLARRGVGAPRFVVRVAALSSGHVDADLDAVMPGRPDVVLLPGAVGAADVQRLAAKLAVREAEHGWPVGRTGIAATAADTAAGVLALGTLPGASSRLLALGWDPAALANGLGVHLDAAPLRTARDLLLVAAAAAGVPAVDGGPPGDDVAAACDAGRRDGFAGRLARRPDQVPVIRARFRPHGG